MIKRLNYKKHKNNIPYPGGDYLELYGSYTKNRLDGYIWLETYKEKGLNIGFHKIEPTQGFFTDLMKFFNYCSLFLDWVYFSCEVGSNEERLVKILMKRKPYYKITKIDTDTEKEPNRVFYVAGFQI